MNRPDAVIFDMDGTLCDVSSIRHLVRGQHANFHAFHIASGSCPPHDHVVAAARTTRQAGLAVLVVTARKARYRNVTAMWLALNAVPSDALYMRADHDNRPDYDVKRGILARIRASWNPVHTWDDNPAVCRLWAEEGIAHTVVPGWQETE